MTAVLLAVALLCGVPLGFIVGVVAGARMYRKVAEDEPDYSGEV